MATVTLQELLSPQVILDLISRIRPGQGTLGKWLGFQPNSFDPQTVSLSGPATVGGGPLNSLRYVTYRIFNNTRTVAPATAPAAAPATVIRNPMAAVQVTCPRFHAKIPLNYEELSNLSPMIGPNSQVDGGGQNYIRQQEMYLASKFGQAVEMMAAGMLRNSLYFIQSGVATGQGPSAYTMSFTAPTGSQFGFQVNFQIPSTSQGQFAQAMGTDSTAGSIITVPWDNPSAQILGDIQKVKAAFAQLHGWPLKHIWINSTMWQYIITNTQVREAAGTASSPFKVYEMVGESASDGGMPDKYSMVLAGDPTVTWHINDDIVSLGSDIDISYTQSNGTATKLIPDNMAIFCVEPSPETAKLYLGGEYVVENPGMPGAMRSGYYFWHEYVTQPSVVELIGLLNAVPCLYNPTVYAAGTVRGF